jgi:hypothetical protein
MSKRVGAANRVVVIPPARRAEPDPQSLNLSLVPSPGEPPDRPVRSDELYRLALGAYQRLYKAVDWDDPDVGANISFMVGRSLLERRALDEPWTVPADRADRVAAWVNQVMSTTDERRLSEWFSGFVELIVAEVNGQMPHGPGGLASLADRWTEVPTPV